MTRTTILAIVLAALLVGAAAAPAVAAQSTDSGFLDGMLSDDASKLSQVSAFLGGILAKWDHRGTPDDAPMIEERNETMAFYNENSDSFESYVNKRGDATTSDDVLELTIKNEAGDSATLFFVADVSDSSFENSSIVESTSRNVDHSCTLSGSAAANAEEELRAFHSNFVEPDDDVTRSYLIKKRVEYSGDTVSCSFMEDS